MSATSPTLSTRTAKRASKPMPPRSNAPPAPRWRFVTIPSLQGEPIEDVANTIFRAWGVGQKGKNEGILLLLSIQDRRSRLEVGYGLEPIIPDGFAGSVLREMRPALRQQQYGEALMAAAQTIGSTVAKAKNVTITDTAAAPHAPARPSGDIPWPADHRRHLPACWLFRAGGPRGYGGAEGGGGFLPGLILGNMMSRGSWGSRGSGGFGGFDSGEAASAASAAAIRRRRRFQRLVISWTNYSTNSSRSCRRPIGDRLVSVVLYGSAATGDHQAKFSDYNVLCVLTG